MESDEQKEVTVQVSVEMPFDIRSIQCPTHKVKIKVQKLIQCFVLRSLFNQICV